jgi:hypothetical protein
MKHVIRLNRLLVAVAGVAAALSLGQAAQAGPAEPQVPTDIAVPAGHKLFLVGHAVGVQIHRCDAIGDGYRWNFVGPRAELFGDNGRLLTTHFAGPRWQAKDGSTVVGSLDGRVTVDPAAIPWLRLTASGSIGPDGDRLAGTTYIQRIATTGGLAPAPASCNADAVGTVEEVSYTADYTFWKATGN